MPAYDYRCTGCGEQLEVQRSISDPVPTTCSHCGSPLKRIFSAIGVVLKGTGFYRTDSRAHSQAPS
jgi:putative FmdB family regulatory protein